MESKNIAYISMLKIVAIVMVCFCHSSFMVPRVNMWLTLTSTLCFAGVPIFLMVNGALLLNKDLDVSKHIKKTMALFLACIVWQGLIGAINAKVYNNQIELTFQSIYDFIVLGKSNIYHSGHIWYMRALVSIYLLLPLLKTAYDKYYTYVVHLAIIIFATYILKNTVNSIVYYVVGYSVNINFAEWMPFSDTTGWCLFFFMIGGILHKEMFVSRQIYDKRPSFFLYLLAIFGGLCLYLIKVSESGLEAGLMSVSYSYQRVSTAILAISLFVIIMFKEKGLKAFLAKKQCGLLRYVSNNTLGIFYVHMLWLYPSRIALQYLILDKGSLLWTICETILVLIFSTLSTWIIKKTPIFRRLLY